MDELVTIARLFLIGTYFHAQEKWVVTGQLSFAASIEHFFLQVGWLLCLALNSHVDR